MDFFEKLENLEDKFFSKFDKVGEAVVPKVEDASERIDNHFDNVVNSVENMNATDPSLVKKVYKIEEWDNYLFGIPKWNFGGKRAYIGYNGIFGGGHCYFFSVIMNSPMEARDCIIKYRECFLNSGWVMQANPLHLYKIINGVKWHADFENVYGNDQRTLVFNFNQV